jgi:hypothetical protein
MVSPSFFSYFNQFVLGFLQEFQRNSLLTNVDLNLYKTNVDSDVLPQLLPLFISVESLNLFHIDIVTLTEIEYSNR